MVDCDDCINRINRGSYWECKHGLDIIKNNYKSCDLKVSQINKGKKYDTGKNRMGLMCENFSRALWEVAKVSTFGSQKYGDNTWQKLSNPKKRYMDALCRHLFQHLQGKKVDSESGLLHLQHMCWNALALLEFELKGKTDNIEFKAPIDIVEDYIKTEEGAKKIMEIMKESENEE